LEGAVLLRGFSVGGLSGFEAAVRALSGEPLSYVERSSPRRAMRGNIYTSTEYPAEEEIFLHNENSYQASWPSRLHFYCVEPAGTGGATPIADTRRILRSIDPAVRTEFRTRGWMLVRNYRDDVGLSWKEAFNTSHRSEVVDYCVSNGIDCRWEHGGLQTTSVREAIHRHPQSGELVWFNHLTVFHVSTMRPFVKDALLELCGPEGLPSNAFYGDGESISPEILDHLRACYRSCATRFDYERNDVLVIDNMLTAHGREPFTGSRRIAVAMTN
jgi:alpha-ketoglutarate-dependent taurine dioxygenase